MEDKLAEIHMVATKNNSKSNVITKDKYTGKLGFSNKYNTAHTYFIPQHLYFTVEEDDIRMYDTVYCSKPEYSGGRKIIAVDSKEKVALYNRLDYYKKIVASTNEELQLAKPSISFVHTFCNADGIDRVLIKYIIDPEKVDRAIQVLEPRLIFGDTIEITLIKSKWNRKELIALLKECVYDNTGIELEDVDNEVDNWITKKML